MTHSNPSKLLIMKLILNIHLKIFLISFLIQKGDSTILSNYILSLINNSSSSLGNFPKLGADILETETSVSRDIAQLKAGEENEDTKLNGTQLMEKYGFTVEEHTVTTEDGYILKLFRIPGTVAGSPVLIMHGAFSSSDDWITVGPENALPYYLASEGYDVWLGNMRGNKYSKQHVNLSTSDDRYWNYSFHEIGIYDLPAKIDYILELTNQTKLTYVGWSQGTAFFYVMASEKPEYNDKINLMISTSTSAWMSNIKSPVFKILTALYPADITLLKIFGVNDILPDDNVTRAFVSIVCGNNPISLAICSNIIFLAFGFDRGHLNVTNLPVVFSHTPAGSSTKQVEHLLQTIKSGLFCQFDYGEIKNLEVYGSSLPKNYTVENISVPVAIFYSNNDWVADPKDIEILKSKLQNVVDYYYIDGYNHVDHLWARDVKELSYTRMLKLIKQYQ